MCSSSVYFVDENTVQLFEPQKLRFLLSDSIGELGVRNGGYGGGFTTEAQRTQRETEEVVEKQEDWKVGRPGHGDFGLRIDESTEFGSRDHGGGFSPQRHRVHEARKSWIIIQGQWRRNGSAGASPYR
jgi:hypothetical protein